MCVTVPVPVGLCGIRGNHAFAHPKLIAENKGEENMNQTQDVEAKLGDIATLETVLDADAKPELRQLQAQVKPSA